MMRLCSLSEHCRSEILKKLENAGAVRPTEIVETLCKEGYIDEARYARAFARDKSSLQGWGSGKIKLALLKKGISSETIVAALCEIDGEAAREKLRQIVSAKWRTLSSEKDELKKQAKLFRYALGRGYGYDEIRKEYDLIRGN